MKNLYVLVAVAAIWFVIAVFTGNQRKFANYFCYAACMAFFVSVIEHFDL